MSNVVISVENVGKRYALGAGRSNERYTALRDVIAGAAAAPIQRLATTIRDANRRRRNGNAESAPGDSALTSGDGIVDPDTSLPPASDASVSDVEKGSPPDFWALKDVSFAVKQGEVIGIIGRNGAGKSTLLKILSRITEPTTGRVRIKGRVASLLEVGTGFHPELTGRENIFLNGAILGMTRAEILKKFDEIVAFAEVERFLDTAVKKYSSGMYVRLAFAVAAHLDPKILIVDEVLAVGDAAFQKKCLGRMSEVSQQGRTVIFVSHNMQSVQRLCGRVIVLSAGQLSSDDLPHEAIRHYSGTSTIFCSERVWPSARAGKGSKNARLVKAQVLDDKGVLTDGILDVEKSYVIQIEYASDLLNVQPTAIIHFYNEDGICLFSSNEYNSPDWNYKPRRPGKYKVQCRIPKNFMAEGSFSVLLAIGSYSPDEIHHIERDALTLQFVDNIAGKGVRGAFTGHWPGVVRPMLEWSIDVT